MDCSTWEKVRVSRSRWKARAVFNQAEEGWGRESTRRHSCMMPVRHTSDGSGGWLDVRTLSAGERLGWRHMCGRHSRQSCLKLRWWGHLRGKYRQDTEDIQSNPKILHHLKIRKRRSLLERKLRWKVWATVLCCWCSVAKSCLILCNPMDCSMPGFPVLHYLPEFLKLMSIESGMLSNHLITCYPLLFVPSIFSSIRIFSDQVSNKSSTFSASAFLCFT